MLVEVNRHMLISLVKGCDPSYTQMDIPLVKANGSYAASYDTWSWKYGAFDGCTEQELWKLYQLLISPAPKHPVEVKEDQDLQEVWEILQDGIRRGNLGQIAACRAELDRVARGGK